MAIFALESPSERQDTQMLRVKKQGSLQMVLKEYKREALCLDKTFFSQKSETINLTAANRRTAWQKADSANVGV